MSLAEEEVNSANPVMLRYSWSTVSSAIKAACACGRWAVGGSDPMIVSNETRNRSSVLDGPHRDSPS